VTVRVTTSRICRTVDLDSRFEPVTVAFAVFGVVAPDAEAVASAAAAAADPGISVYRRPLSAASQSKGDRIDLALQGVMGELTPPQSGNGDVGLRLGKLGFVAGADIGY
jgi:hypothetical protein